MKPHWKNAPEWAQWLAQDGDGEWWWFEHKPAPNHAIASWCRAEPEHKYDFAGYSLAPIGPAEPRP